MLLRSPLLVRLILERAGSTVICMGPDEALQRVDESAIEVPGTAHCMSQKPSVWNRAGAARCDDVANVLPRPIPDADLNGLARDGGATNKGGAFLVPCPLLAEDVQRGSTHHLCTDAETSPACLPPCCVVSVVSCRGLVVLAIHNLHVFCFCWRVPARLPPSAQQHFSLFLPLSLPAILVLVTYWRRK